MTSIKHQENLNPFDRYGSITICQTLTRLRLDKNNLKLIFERSKYLFDNPSHPLTFNARGLATWLYQCSRHYNTTTRSLFKGKLRASWYGAAINKIQEFGAQNLANSIYAFAKLSFR